MQFLMRKHSDYDDVWVVEATGEAGEIYQAQFYGPQAERRAAEYQQWASAHFRP